jgi:enamine deaminase RidA (YjgF/YER057c/UK114 family)
MKVHFPMAVAGRIAAGGALALAVGALAHAAPAPVTRIQPRAIAESVTVPPGYDTIYFSGTGAGGPPGSPPMDTEAQALATLEKIKGLVTAKGMTMGDLVMMHAYVAVDPKLGKADLVGWNQAYAKYFGTPEQPNKPVRAAMQVAALATSWGLVEIQVVAVKSK